LRVVSKTDSVASRIITPSSELRAKWFFFQHSSDAIATVWINLCVSEMDQSKSRANCGRVAKDSVKGHRRFNKNSMTWNVLTRDPVSDRIRRRVCPGLCITEPTGNWF